MPADTQSLKHWKSLNRGRKEELIRQLKYAHDSRNDNFTSLLIRLMHKADINNFPRLRKAYPDEAAVEAAWFMGYITEHYEEG